MPRKPRVAALTVGKLRKILEGLDDDIPIMRGTGGDHNYLPLRGAQPESAELTTDQQVFEYYGEGTMFKGSQRIDILRLE